MRNDVVAELRTLDFRRAGPSGARSRLRVACVANRAVEAFQNQVRRFGPAQVAEHHFAGKRDETGLTTSLFAYWAPVPCVASKMAWPVT